MEVLKKGITTDQTKIQIENWNDDYSFMEYGNTIGAYPIAKQTGNRQFEPERGRTFRLSYEFEDSKEAEAMFNELVTGSKTLKCIESYLKDDKYKDFI